MTLVEQILCCVRGQEMPVLQRYPDLLDAGLLAVMGQYADRLESQGNGNAGWLRQVAAGLAQALGLGENSSSSTSSRDGAAFLMKIVQLIGQTGRDRGQVYECFRVNVGRLDEALLSALPTVFAGLIQRNNPSIIAAVFNEFGNLIQQFPLGSRILNLEMGIVAYEQALQVYTCDAFPEDWAGTQNNLATAYTNRIRGERADNLEQAIMAYQQALQVYTCDAFPEDWAGTQNNLANAYLYRICGDRANNLEQAIVTYEQALQVRTRDAFPQQWAETQNNLATAYKNRIRGDRADNLEQAITAYEQVLQVRTRDAFPQQWAETQNNLATAYWKRIRGDRAQNLEDAITAYKQVLQVRTRAAFPEDWAMTQNNLANAYSNRIRRERADNLEQAITAYQQALQVYTRVAFPEQWAGTQNNLASAYSNRIRGEQADNLEQAIMAYQQALQVRTRDAFPQQWAETQNNLAFAYWKRIQGDRAQNLEDAITSYQRALEIRTREAFPTECRQTARNLGNLYFEQQAWSEAENAFTSALSAAEVLYQSCLLLDSKAAELANTADLPRLTAYTLARIGKLQTAIEVLEQGRARGLSESLNRDRANLTQLQQTCPELYTEYQDITQQLRNLENRDRDRMVSTDRDRVPEDLTQTMTKLRQKLDQTIAQIRQVPSYEDFLTPTQWKDIAIALRQDNPLVYLVTTPNGSMVLIVTVDVIEVLWLDDLTETQLIDLLNQTWFAAYNQSQTDRQAWYDAIDTTTRQLWDALMGPLVQKLQDLGFERITLIPTGYLSLLPLHATWTEDESKPTGRRYAFDDIHITYAPNAKSLTAAQTIAVGEASLLENRIQPNSILAIDNPTQDLPNSEREVNAAIASFPQHTVLRQTEATVEAVQLQLPKAAIVHFSCHGTANLNEPLNSGLVMTDGLLTLKDIFALNLAETGGIRLTILSACETGLIGTENADETISLPTGLLQAGVAAVIASLWSVSDLSTMLLLTRFYDFWRIEGLEIDQALHQAQQWVRDTTNREKADYFKTFLPATAGVKAPAAIAQDLFRSLILKRPNERDFAHPFHWAAFSYTGV
ncbi:CHAT domain-containing protein [Leptolyngbya sp. 'hensonii']|uniref:CHAT domain-containing tetratricopeptide repeat protein n=1 Tax=Leptolyngbya sp. 'hensonii' TaxID=1922337 RepID=UPI0015C560BC|nr:CHAT domain-containing protein [Leptolyngbya sp. 'hensonii']